MPEPVCPQDSLLRKRSSVEAVCYKLLLLCHLHNWGHSALEEFSKSVALFDFAPVFLGGIGMVLAARTVGRWHANLASTALIAALLIPLGGVCKASWKLVIALTGTPITALENLLFLLMAPGFVLLAASVARARRQWVQSTTTDGRQGDTVGVWLWLLVPLVGAGLAVAAMPDTRAWFVWLLGVTVVANAGLLIQAGLWARAAGGGRLTIALLGFNFVATLTLSGLARMDDGEATAWIQQTVNLFAQGSLALAFWRLHQRLVPTSIPRTAPC